MPSKFGNFGNKVNIKKLCLYSVLCAACMVLGYVETLLDLSFIAPGMKVGLANIAACTLILRGDIKGAFAVNVSRILLSALIFGSLISLVFALCGGVVSMAAMYLAGKFKRFSPVGVSIAGGVVHNTVQCAVGLIFVGVGVVYYLPILLISGLLCGAAVGTVSTLILKRLKKEGKYV